MRQFFPNFAIYIKFRMFWKEKWASSVKYFWSYSLRKMCLFKCITGLVSENPLAVNVLMILGTAEMRSIPLKYSSTWLFWQSKPQSLPYWTTGKHIFKVTRLLMQKQLPRGALRKMCSENMLQIYRRTTMPKCDLQLYWNHTSARVFSYKFATYFQNVFS